MRRFVACLVGVSVLLVACRGNLADHVSFGANADLFRGPAHCDWQDTWLILIETDEISGTGDEDMPGWHMFVRDPGAIPEYDFHAEADLQRKVPSDAALLREGESAELWYSLSDPDYIFLIDGDRTEVRVRASEWGLCA